MTSTALDARYGRRPDDSRRQRRFAIIAAVVVVLVFAVWTLWRFLGSTDTEIEATIRGFDPISSTQLEVTALVTFDREQTAICALEVLGSNKQIVGWMEVEIGPSDERMRVVVQTVNTVERGVTGLISGCRFA